MQAERNHARILQKQSPHLIMRMRRVWLGAGREEEQQRRGGAGACRSLSKCLAANGRYMGCHIS